MLAATNYPQTSTASRLVEQDNRPHPHLVSNSGIEQGTNTNHSPGHIEPHPSSP